MIQSEGVSNPGEINDSFKKNRQNKIGIFVKLHEMEELRRVQERPESRKTA